MIIEEKINLTLEDFKSKEFLISQLETIKGNIIESEKRIRKKLILVLSFIAIAELISKGVITKIGFFATEVNDLKLVLIIMPSIIAYYSYSLYNQLVLRLSLNKLFYTIIKSEYPTISNLDIDYFLITHFESNTEDIFTAGKRNWVKILIEITSIPFIAIFQYLPIIYCFYLLCDIHQNEPVSLTLFWISFTIAILFFIRAILLFIASIKEFGGLKQIISEIFSIELKSKPKPNVNNE